MAENVPFIGAQILASGCIEGPELSSNSAVVLSEEEEIAFLEEHFHCIIKM